MSLKIVPFPIIGPLMSGNYLVSILYFHFWLELVKLVTKYW